MRYDELQVGDVQIGGDEVWMVIAVSEERNTWLNLETSRQIGCARDRSEITIGYEVIRAQTTL